MEMILGLLVLFPFLAGGVAYGAGRRSAEGQNCKEGHNPAVLTVIFACGVEVFLMAGLSAWLFCQRGSGGLLEWFIPEVCGFGLYFVLDGFRVVYGCITALAWLVAAIVSREYFAGEERCARFYLFFLWTYGAVMGVFLSGDLFTTFLFFEAMSFTSYVWVAQEESDPALEASATYLAVAVIGGLVMLMGIFLLYNRLGTLKIGELAQAAAACGDKRVLYVAGGCLFFGFGAKAGAFPLHIWLPKAHPAAPAPASALLSGILTKTGIFGVLVVSCQLFYKDSFWGSLVLTMGVATMLVGAVLALYSVDLKRTLACSSVSQVGFILVGIGMQGLLGEERNLAAYGTLLHMVNHSLIKLLLFLAAGILYKNTHSLDLNRIRGFGRRKPLLAAIFGAGALCLMGIPGFGGYVSKTLLHESILAYGGGSLMRLVEVLFLFSGGLTVAYMLKLFVAIFVEKNRDGQLQEAYDRKKKYMGAGSSVALGGTALLLLAWGVLPHAFMERVAGAAESFLKLDRTGSLGQPGIQVAYFSLENLKGALISIAAGGLVYGFYVRKVLMRKTPGGDGKIRSYVNRWPWYLDLERCVYRPLLLKAVPVLLGVACRILDCLVDACVVVLRKSLYHDSALPYELPEGNSLTAWLGRMLNRWQWLGNHTWNRKHPAQKEYVHLAAAKYDEIRENSILIQRSLSFGLLLFALGLVVTLVYLLLW